METCDYILSIHYIFDDGCSFKNYKDFTSFLDEFFDIFKKEYNKLVDKDYKFPDNYEVKLIRIKEGSGIFEFLIEKIIIAVAEKVLAEIVLKVGSKLFGIIIEKAEILIHNKFFSSKKRWSQNDEELFVKKANEIYVKNKKQVNKESFIKKLPFIFRLKYGRVSLEMKLANEKYLLNKHNIKNNLDIYELSHFSKRHEKLLKKINKIK